MGIEAEDRLAKRVRHERTALHPCPPCLKDAKRDFRGTRYTTFRRINCEACPHVHPEDRVISFLFVLCIYARHSQTRPEHVLWAFPTALGSRKLIQHRDSVQVV